MPRRNSTTCKFVMSSRHICIHFNAMKTKSNSNLIAALTSLVSYFKQYGYDIKVIHSDHEGALISATSFINQQGIQYHTISPYQQEQKLESYVQTITVRFRSVLSSLKYKLPNKLYVQLFIAILIYINILPNSVHLTLTPSIIFQGYKLVSTPKLRFPSGYFPLFIMPNESSINMSLAPKIASSYMILTRQLHQQCRCLDPRPKYARYNQQILYQDNAIIIRSHIPDFLTISPRP